MTKPTDVYDAVVVGGGAAGMSAALTLVRARRSTLVADVGEQSNRASSEIRGLAGHDGVSPAEYYDTLVAELRSYPDFDSRRATVTGVERDVAGFTVAFDDGVPVGARRVVLAMGTRYDYPDLPGIHERWGGSAFHCPFCHGWEVRGVPLGVLADGAVGAHGALNLRTWSDEITLLTNGPSSLGPEDRDRLAAGGVGIDERPIAGLNGPGADLKSVSFADGPDLELNGLLVKSILRQRSPLARDLGLRVIEPDEMLSVEAITVDRMHQTEIPGIYAVGDAATSVPPSVHSALASGHLAGAVIVTHLAAGY